MIVPVMAISNLVLTQQIYSEETNGAHAHYREPVPLNWPLKQISVWSVSRTALSDTWMGKYSDFPSQTP